jgi:peptidoglycan biosynthesis protein MviN/MurJ (putative lipid II flippase)
MTPICAYALAAACVVGGFAGLALYVYIAYKLGEWSERLFGGDGAMWGLVYYLGPILLFMIHGIAQDFAKTCCAR